MPSSCLTIGVDRVDPTRYGMPLPAMRCSESDAFDVAQLLDGRGFQPQCLRGSEATLASVEREIAIGASQLRPGETFVLYFAGHGAQVPDLGFGEADGRNETWCLYDGQLLDRVLYGQLTEFGRGTQVVIVADCCHSGDDATWNSPIEVAPVGATPRGLPRAMADRLYDHNATMYNLQPRLQVPRAQALSASVLLLASCQAGELAFEALDRGIFTGALLEALYCDRFPTYDDLIMEVNALTHRCQTPRADMLSDVGTDLRRGVRPFRP